MLAFCVNVLESLAANSVRDTRYTVCVHSVNMLACAACFSRRHYHHHHNHHASSSSSHRWTEKSLALSLHPTTTTTEPSVYGLVSHSKARLCSLYKFAHTTHSAAVADHSHTLCTYMQKKHIQNPHKMQYIKHRQTSTNTRKLTQPHANHKRRGPFKSRSTRKSHRVHMHNIYISASRLLHSAPRSQEFGSQCAQCCVCWWCSCKFQRVNFVCLCENARVCRSGVGARTKSSASSSSLITHTHICAKAHAYINTDNNYHNQQKPTLPPWAKGVKGTKGRASGMLGGCAFTRTRVDEEIV